MGSMDANRGVGCPWATSHHADAGLAGETTPGFGSVGGTTLVAKADVVDAAADKGVKHRKVAFAGDPEGVGDVMRSEGINDKLTAGSWFCHWFRDLQFEGTCRG